MKESRTQVPVISEDWLAVAIGGVIFLLSLAPFAGIDLLGWSASTRIFSGLEWDAR